MSSYILSTANRLYVALEGQFGVPALPAAQDRIVASTLHSMQSVTPSVRRDKTGSRSIPSPSANGFRMTAFELRSYFASNGSPLTPLCGSLFQAALGGAPSSATGLIVSSAPNAWTLQTTAPHGLAAGSALSVADEIRFVTAVLDAQTVAVNAPLSTTPSPGLALPPSVTYPLRSVLPSVTIYDYWDPAAAVSRITTGATVNSFEISLQGGLQQFVFSGNASDLLDSADFVPGTAGLTSFPPEPPLEPFDYSIVPASLGQAWLGSSPNQFFTLTEASIRISNHSQLRNREFGSSTPVASVPGRRQVSIGFTLLAQDDAQTTALYQIAKQRGTMSVLLQFGERTGRMMAVYLPCVTPEIPAFDDTGAQLAWHFSNNQAGGPLENELYLAFA